MSETPKSPEPTIIEAESPQRDILISETYRVHDETLIARFRREAARTLRELFTILRSSLFVLPAMFLAALTMDVSFRGFDGPFDQMRNLAPGNWISQGSMYMMLSLLVLLLVTRRYGAVVATRAIGMSWLLMIILSTIVLLWLAPTLNASDLPSGRYVLAFSISWMVAQIVAVQMYDLTRGSKWWRAPLYGGLIGLTMQTLIFFPTTYGGYSVPWVNWMVTDVVVKAVCIIAFLVPYHLLRRTIKPFIGLGGL